MNSATASSAGADVYWVLNLVCLSKPDN